MKLKTLTNGEKWVINNLLMWNVTAGLQHISPLKIRSLFFFFWQCLILAQCAKKLNKELGFQFGEGVGGCVFLPGLKRPNTVKRCRDQRNNSNNKRRLRENENIPIIAGSKMSTIQSNRR